MTASTATLRARIDRSATARLRIVERFQIDLEMSGTAERTAEIYAIAARALHRWLEHRDDGRWWDQLDSDDITLFLHAYGKGLDGFKPHAKTTVNQVYRSLSSFYKWHSHLRGATYTSPMHDVVAPRIGEVRYDGKVLSPKEVGAIVASVAYRRDFVSVRNHAIVQLLLLGLRRNEILSLTEERITLRSRDRGSEITVLGKGDAKGSRTRTLAIGHKTAMALLDYLEVREMHELAHLPDFWLGQGGALQPRGFNRMIERLGAAAGVEHVYPHRFRHTAASRWLEAGGSENEAMEHFGWTSREMPDRYARETRAERARATARRIGLDG